MQPTEAAKADQPAGVAPSPNPKSPWRVRTVKVLEGASLEVEFLDGTSGSVHLEEFLARPQVTGSVFEPLRDPREFRSVTVVLGAVQWPCGADLAPDAMYEAIRQHGRWVLR